MQCVRRHRNCAWLSVLSDVSVDGAFPNRRVSAVAKSRRVVRPLLPRDNVIPAPSSRSISPRLVSGRSKCHLIGILCFRLLSVWTKNCLRIMSKQLDRTTLPHRVSFRYMLQLDHDPRASSCVRHMQPILPPKHPSLSSRATWALPCLYSISSQ